MPKQKQPFILIVGQFLLKNRWLVFVIGVLIVTTIETVERWPTIWIYKHLLYELLIYGFIGPFIIWILLTMLDRALTVTIQVDRIQAEATRAERQRIARDLHDKLAQNLGYLHFKLDQLATSGEATLTEIESIQTDLEQMRQTADQAYEQVRGTLDTLRYETKIPDDLAMALRHQTQTVANTHLDIKIDYHDNVKSLCPIIKRTIIDITHEALSNINKHAQAKEVTIDLSCDQSDTFLTITDNGQGFQVDNNHTGHYGLEIMQERAKEVGGQLNIKSTLGQGTELIVQLPNSVISEPLLLKCESLRCDYLMLCKNEDSVS